MPRLPRPRLTPEVRTLIRLGIPGAIAGGITQINLLVGGIIASLEDGARAILYYADRLYQLPLGVIGVALGVALLPELSRRLRAGDASGVANGQNRALEIALYFTLPAAVALAVMPEFLISVLFERGAFEPGATQKTADALRIFALGLPAFVMIKVFSPAFFAREDTKTPMKFAAAGVALNIVVSLSLFWSIGFLAIALATTLAGWLNAGLLWHRLRKLGHFELDAKNKGSLPKMGLASIIMGAAVSSSPLGANRPLRPVFRSNWAHSFHCRDRPWPLCRPDLHNEGGARQGLEGCAWPRGLKVVPLESRPRSSHKALESSSRVGAATRSFEK